MPLDIPREVAGNDLLGEAVILVIVQVRRPFAALVVVEPRLNSGLVFGGHRAAHRFEHAARDLYRSVDQILKKYRGAKKEIYSAIDAVVKLRDRLAKAEAPELVAFSKDVNKKIPALNELQSALHEFDVDIVGAYNDIASQKDDSDNIARKRGHFERAAKGHDSAADKARKQFLDLASHFKLIEKKLK